MGDARTAARFAAVYAALWAAHDLGDHVVQTDHQAAGKSGREGWAGPMAGHVGTYIAVQAAGLTALQVLVGVRMSPARLLAGLAWSAGTHALLDRRWPVVALLDATGSRGFARPQVQVTGSAVPSALRGRDPIVEAGGPLPLPGPYLADQSLHHGAVFVAALIIAGRRGRG